MATQPTSTGRYSTIFLPARNRRDNLHATHKEPTPLPAVPDNARTAEAIMRRARDLGVGPMETLRRHLDQETRQVAARLAELEGGR